jgi:hypothetical protein
MFCRFCGKEIHETAINCPGCGGIQSATSSMAVVIPGTSIWMAVSSLTTGLLGMLTLMDESSWDMETAVGVVLLFSCPAAIWGIWTLAEKRAGKNMAIAGIVMAVIIFLSCLGIGLDL